jgi:hypothetical protein
VNCAIIGVDAAVDPGADPTADPARAPASALRGSGSAKKLAWDGPAMGAQRLAEPGARLAFEAEPTRSTSFDSA